MNKITAKMLRACLKNSVANLEANKELVNSLNVFPVPDGDTGTNMFLTIQSAAKYGLQESSDHCGKIAMAASKGALMGARGNSGVILSQILRGFAQGVENDEVLNTASIIRGVENAALVSYKAVMKPTEGTILTVIRKMAEFAKDKGGQYDSCEALMQALLTEGQKALDDTPNLLPVLKEAGVVDAGGKGLLVIAEGAYDGVLGKEMEYEIEPAIKKKDFAHHHIHEEEIEFGYCTEFMIHTEYDDIPKLKKKLVTFGDSLVCVQTDDVIKIHIHTNNPGDVIQLALSLGYLTDIKVDNMRFQHHNLVVATPNSNNGPTPISEKQKKNAFITVAAGQGIVDLFHDLQVDYVVIGGQTMNPSVEDFIEAIDSQMAENIYILPNNSNIILTAENAAKISNKNVHVVPTRTIPQGICAMLNFDEEEDNILEHLTNSITQVKSGALTYAVRDTKISDKEIKEGDYMSLLNGEIIDANHDRFKVLKSCIENAVDEDTSIITLFAGENISDEILEEDGQALEELYPEIVIETIRGDQPVYYYLISIE
ncbi:MAG: DAK2 domain-containing protein [Tissierellia bacterium]|nr:DAK2 domain-containing protein [Tissierellia bacterium]